MRLPSANRECASCHVMWLTDFKRDDVATLIPYDPKPVMNTGKQDMASSEPVCFSCHDGFVLDSRFLWKEGKHAHPVGVKPSNDVTIPLYEGKNLYPLNDDGKIYCGTCHTAHGVDWEQDKTAIFMRVSNENGQLCMSCHVNKTKGAGHGTHPVKVKIQDLLKSPPVNLMKAGGRFTNDGDVVCQSCHIPHAAPEKKLLLLKNNKSQLCGECHSDRYPYNRKQAGEMGTHPVNIPSNSIDIPDNILKQGGKLSDTGEMICETCHSPHSAKKNTSLLVKKNENDSLCKSCHIDQKKIINSKHDMVLVEPSSVNKKNQSAKKQGTCSACHLSHDGSGPKMWARKVTAGEESMAALCLSCHKSEGLADKHQVGEYTHPVGAEISRLQKPVNLPSFSKEGVKSVKQMKGAVTCASCHDVHQWNPVDESDKGKIDEDGNNRTNFLRIANGSSAELCKTCHEEKWNVVGSKHDMRYMAPQSKNVLGQTIVESGICGSCHLVHNANGPRLWARADLHGQGTGYAACVGCHHEKGLAKNKTIGEHTHPIGAEITKLGIQVKSGIWSSKLFQRSTDGHQGKTEALQTLPLYDSKGNATVDNGRVGCGSCHDPHDWSTQEHSYKDHPKNIEGDVNSSFLRIADKGKSTLCVNCHLDKKPVFNTRHDLTVKPDARISPVKEITNEILNNEKNNLKKASKTKSTSTCMYCHKPHNANDNKLWARGQGKSSTLIGRLCADCHQEDGLAKNKLTGMHSHPVGAVSNKDQLYKDLPVYDESGNRVNESGLLDCSSCHDPHQWDPDNNENKGMSLISKEGTTANSFLRLTANNNSKLCINCHAENSTIIGTDHDLGVTATNETNSLGQKRDDSGVCGQCHVPHNADDDLYLWGKQTGSGEDLIEKRCRSCHSSGKVAEDKNPVLSSHPNTVNMWSTELRQKIMDRPFSDIKVYDQSGRTTNYGSITCASCHNPHKWSEEDNALIGGKNQEGNAKNSFLRINKSEGMVCVDCHGLDAIYRYKYFHGEGSHKKHHMFR